MNNDDFERVLRQQSIGPATEPGGELMYRCGFAAGMSAANRRFKSRVARCQGLAWSAATLACLAVGWHMSHFPTQQTDQSSAMIQLPHESASFVEMSPMATSSKELPAQSRWNAEEPAGVLRAVTKDLQILDGDLSAIMPSSATAIRSTYPNGRELRPRILKPTDYHSLLQGEV